MRNPDSNETARMLTSLELGWDAQSTRPLQFVDWWGHHVSGQITLRGVDTNLVYFVTDISAIRLRGTDEVHVCIISSDPDASIARAFYRRVVAPGRLVFLLFCSPSSNDAIENMPSLHRAVLASRPELEELIQSPEPLNHIRQLLLAKLPRISLIPFNNLRSAEGNMFYGRRVELNRLLDHDEVAFAVAGPSRIGKTSLVKQYIRELYRTRHYLARSTFFVDCYECVPKDDDSVARFLAMRVDSTSHAGRVRLANIPQFIRYLRSKCQQVPNIVLDEVDEICNGGVVDQLSALAKHGYCRLILCGRGVLLSAILDSGTSLAARFTLLRLKPLDPTAAARLFVEPMRDLEISFESDELVAEVLRWTGALPHLVQFCGRRLAERCLESHSSTISISHFHDLQWEFETVQYFTTPLSDVMPLVNQVLALTILRMNPKVITCELVIELAREEGVLLDMRNATRICNELVVCNILRWSTDLSHSEASVLRRQDHTPELTYQVSTTALREYAAKLGFLGAGLAESRSRLRRARRS